MLTNKFKNGDTIYAPASSTQKSGIIIVRISGPEALNVYKLLNFPKPKVKEASVVKLYHPKTKILIDQAVVLSFKAPHSFTGEDVLEICIHGSKIILKLLCDALSYLKHSRFAEAGEFTMRAFINNKMDLTQIEGLADLLDAETEVQHQKAMQQMSGQLTNLYNDWRNQLIKIKSLVEAYIDFPDEEIPEHITTTAQHKIKNLIDNIQLHISNSKRGEKIHEGLLVTIIGPTNAGKSSLMNVLSERDIAIVSNIEGTTRDVIETFLNIDGFPIILADTAGLRESNEIIEKEGIKRSLTKAANADIKIVIFDGTSDYTKETTALNVLDENSILVLNKHDAMSKTQQQSVPQNALCISTKNGMNINKLIQEISNRAHKLLDNTESPLITRERYRHNLTQCIASLKECNLNKDLVLAAEDLRLASSHLSRITGKIDVESILDEIFSSFCIGK